MRETTKKKLDTIHPPQVPYHKMHSAYIQFEGQTYPVATCPSSIFKWAVKQSHPSFSPDGSIGCLLAKSELDMVDRWYIINELAKLRHPMKLI